MSKLKNTFAIAALTSIAFAPAAFAGEKMEPKMEPAKVETKMTVTETPEARMITIRSEAETEVRGAVERGELIPVEGPDGRIYYNHVVSVSELPDPELDLRVLDTYDISYEGDVYTNKVVQELN